MRTSTIATALFAASTIAQPVIDKRDIVYETKIDIVYTTVWVDFDGAAPSTTLKHTHSAVAVPVSSVAAAVTSAVAAPASSAEAIVAAAPSVDVSSEASETSSAASVASSAVSSGGSSLSDISTSAHNVLRAQHSAGNLVWNETLAESAAQLSATCVFEHDVSYGGGGYGQNIAASFGTLGLHDAATELQQVISGTWYTNEEAQFVSLGLYGVADPIPNDFDAWGHFTQEVWASSTSVGCAVQTCDTGNWQGYFTTCNYFPAGNYAGEFNTNVLQ